MLIIKNMAGNVLYRSELPKDFCLPPVRSKFVLEYPNEHEPLVSTVVTSIVASVECRLANGVYDVIISLTALDFVTHAQFPEPTVTTITVSTP